MPGKRWLRKELRHLRRLREQGMTIPQIVAGQELPGRTKDAISHLLGRRGLVDAERSAKVRAVVRMNAAEHSYFICFLRRNGRAPVGQLAETWNKWAEANGAPQVTNGRVYRWLRKLRIERSRKEACGSIWAAKKRAAAAAERLQAREQELARRALVFFQELKRKVRRKDYRNRERCKCGVCRTAWPLAEPFFKRLPRYFQHGGKFLLDAFQTEMCSYCDTTLEWSIRLYRRFGEPTAELIAAKKARRRAAIDGRAGKELAAAKQSRDALFRRSKKTPRRRCVKCREVWPLADGCFRRNRGTNEGETTYRPICAFCDSEFQRQIRRLQRDGGDPSALVEERAQCSELARSEKRAEHRERARALRQTICRSTALPHLRRCPKCKERWPADRRHGNTFWHLRYYDSAQKGRQWCLSHICRFCIQDAHAVKHSPGRSLPHRG